MLFTLQRSRALLPLRRRRIGVDRLCRFIPQAVKNKLSAFIMAFIRFYLR